MRVAFNFASIHAKDISHKQKRLKPISLNLFMVAFIILRSDKSLLLGLHIHRTVLL